MRNPEATAHPSGSYSWLTFRHMPRCVASPRTRPKPGPSTSKNVAQARNVPGLGEESRCDWLIRRGGGGRLANFRGRDLSVWRRRLGDSNGRSGGKCPEEKEGDVKKWRWRGGCGTAAGRIPRRSELGGRAATGGRAIANPEMTGVFLFFPPCAFRLGVGFFSSSRRPCEVDRWCCERGRPAWAATENEAAMAVRLGDRRGNGGGGA